LNRRQVLATGALWPFSLLGKRRRDAPTVPDGPITLGWRWVPGERLSVRSVTRRESAGRIASRAEEWSWLVREVDLDGVATLEGRLTGFGGGVSDDGVPRSDDELATALAVERARADRVVTLRMGLDGGLVHLDAMAFDEALPHRVFALRVPSVPVAPHDEWPLPGLMRPFQGLVPGDVDATTHGVGRLVELSAEDGRVVATIETTGSTRAAAGPAVHVSGTARWDTGRGGVLAREVVARFTPSAPDPHANPGTLSVTLWRVGG